MFVCVRVHVFVCVCRGGGGKYVLDVFLLSTAVDCGNLTNPANGQVSHAVGTTFGHTATYNCNTGYNQMGGNTRKCQATGEWSGSEPTCERTLHMKLFEVTEQDSTSDLNVDSLCSVIRESDF